MEPAQSIIARLGGVARVVEATGAHRTRVSSWRRPKSVGGTDGLIPQRHHRQLLNYAAHNGIRLVAEDFLAPIEPSASGLADVSSRSRLKRSRRKFTADASSVFADGSSK